MKCPKCGGDPLHPTCRCDTPQPTGATEQGDAIDLLETYSAWLEKQGYMDGDWRHEPPYAIDEFLKTVDN